MVVEFRGEHAVGSRLIHEGWVYQGPTRHGVRTVHTRGAYTGGYCVDRFC